METCIHNLCRISWVIPSNLRKRAVASILFLQIFFILVSYFHFHNNENNILINVVTEEGFYTKFFSNLIS